MKTEIKRNFIIALCFLTAFVFWTFAVCHFDVDAVGPEGSQVGFSMVNRLFHSITGVHFSLYVITDWLGLIPVAVCLGFAVFGLVQWIKRKDIRKVDRDILMLGGFYIAVMAMYILFEYVVINRRPVLINGYLEASYPSSTTLLVLCVMPSAMIQLNRRIKCVPLRQAVIGIIAAFTAFMVVGRLISGVHWLSDIIGGVLLSAGLVMLYRAACNIR
mgnify:CR=1 FL=1